MINYLIDKFYNIKFNLSLGYNKKRIILLGDGFFARGFLHNIDYKKYYIIQIYKDDFINPQDIMYSLQRNKNYIQTVHLKDFFYNSANIKIKTTIKDLDITNKNKVKINDKYFNYNYLVIGLGGHVSLYDWKEKFNKLNNNTSNNTRNNTSIMSIVGMGPTGIELSCILSKKYKINLFDMLSKEKVFKNKDNLLKIIESNNIELLFEKKYDESYSKDVIFCTGTKENILTNKYKTNKYLQIDENIYMGGDCDKNNYIKTAQVAYQQGVYVAKKLNGSINEEFKYNHNGTAINIGDKKVLIENHNILPNGVYPDFIIKIYSLFLI
jgi:NADH dehydrogenase FAD-containing subunit